MFVVRLEASPITITYFTASKPLSNSVNFEQPDPSSNPLPQTPLIQNFCSNVSWPSESFLLGSSL
jgi:hypothetical protein